MASLKVRLMMAAAIALFAMPGFAADLETQVVDKNCWIEVFDDDDFDMKDDHYKIQGPKEFASLKDVGGKNWNNDIESVIVGSNARVKAYSEKDFKGTELALAPGQRVPNLGKLNMKDDIESMKIACGS
jgi:beta/gamma crystallin